MYFFHFITDSGTCHSSLFSNNIIATIVAKFSADKFSGDESTPKTAAPVAGQLVGFHFHDMLFFPTKKREQYQC